jgi:mercuric ion transport protein
MKNLFAIKSIILVGVLAVAFACSSTGKKAEKVTDNGAVLSLEVSISGMTCAGCEQKVQTNVAKLEGVKNVKALSAVGRAFVEYSPSLADTAKIRAAITDAGFIVTGFKPATTTEPSK